MKSRLAIDGGRPIRQKYLTFGAPDIGREEIREVTDTLKSGWISTGPKVARFEGLVGQYLKCRFVKAVHSCTAALHLSLIAAGIGKGDEVITTPLTFSATANVILHVGAIPIFADVDPVTGNIDPKEIEKHITKHTKAIIPVHLYGRPCRMDTIMAIAKRHKLIVIEDAAHAFGASFQGKNVGTIGDATCFSFYVTKNLVTGEGGMVTTSRAPWVSKIEMYALHGMSRGAWKRYSDAGYSHYLIEVPGYKYNMMDLQAALGVVQLKKFPVMQKRRAVIWQRYLEAFKDLPLMLPAPAESDTVHAQHLFTVLANLSKLRVDRNQILQALHKENIGVGVHFISLHVHPYYRKRFGFKKRDFPNALYHSDRTISLPLSSRLTNQDVDDVIAAVRKVFLHYTR
ncbi:MAG: Glutamine-scyllo-inositol transaminase [Candidatus Gottesmanbacteria bacterium GW2011_GWA2_47_9]|uniref:Glutamine-scyllo-inositol transaminase n=1 Tax=Candidatus Gottesmanbacteria bacterium GW2011_GWA2_47_9 TaxID=1618445 RepID=A0A0G1TVW6_9BACT|nr:MAG: Glutamine-scyllo-inositol transaminase [Candidatus Gottesmanbacteria bacterium GW2011_GWA2_47_9]